ncbi:MAG: UDP-glucose 4-epimerase GalE [Thermodesulfovibrionales bacterium]
MDKSILITGGAGYIGSHTNKELNKKGYGTVVVDNLSRGHRDFVKWGELRICDLAEVDALRNIFRSFPIKAVVHFAAFAYVGESFDDPQRYYVNNVLNTINLLSVMREFDVRYLIFSSSCATYGNPVTSPIAETHPQNPISPYGRSKFMAENILADYARAYGLQYVSLRYFNAAGADIDGEIGERHDPETHLIPLVLDVAAGKRDYVEIFGSDYETPDGTCIRDYVHVTDLANAHILALEHLLSGGGSEVFNLGSGSGYSVREIIRAAGNVTQKEISTREAGRRKGDPAVLICSSEKIKKTLSWEPKFGSLDAILNTAWNWHRK